MDLWIDVRADTCPLPKGVVRQSGVAAGLRREIAESGTAKA